MSWSKKQALVKESVKIAEKKHPKGYNKKQLIGASKEVFGGWGKQVAMPSTHRRVKTMDDVNHLGNAMSSIDGHYPAGMSSCFVVGINGDCGIECPVFLEGSCECDDIGVMFDDLKNDEDLSRTEKEDIFGQYGRSFEKGVDDVG